MLFSFVLYCLSEGKLISHVFVFNIVSIFSSFKGTIKEITSTITCPFCRQDTKLTDGVKSLTTNFYIMPRIEKAIAQRYIFAYCDSTKVMVNLFVQEARNKSGVCNRIVQFTPTNRHLFVNIAPCAKQSTPHVLFAIYGQRISHPAKGSVSSRL